MGNSPGTINGWLCLSSGGHSSRQCTGQHEFVLGT